MGLDLGRICHGETGSSRRSGIEIVVANPRTLRLINDVRGGLTSWGERLPNCGTPIFVKRAAEALPDALRPTLDPRVQPIQIITEAIRAVDERIEQLGEQRYPETRLLRQDAGVVPKTALCFILHGGGSGPV